MHIWYILLPDTHMDDLLLSLKLLLKLCLFDQGCTDHLLKIVNCLKPNSTLVILLALLCFYLFNLFIYSIELITF